MPVDPWISIDDPSLDGMHLNQRLSISAKVPATIAQGLVFILNFLEQLRMDKTNSKKKWRSHKLMLQNNQNIGPM